MDKVRVNKVTCRHAKIFYSCWTIILLWMMLSIYNDMGNGAGQHLLDVIGLIGFGAIFVIIISSFGSASGKKMFLCDVCDGIDKNLKRILRCEFLIIFLSIVFLFMLSDCDRCMFILSTPDYRMGYKIISIGYLLFMMFLIYYATSMSKKIANLLMCRYEGRIIPLGAMFVLMVNLFLLMILSGIHYFVKLLIVIWVFYFLYMLYRFVRVNKYRITN